MVDRIAILAENGRASLRGMSMSGPTDFKAWQSDDEAPTYTLDLANLLGAATISSVTRTAHGPTVTNASNTTTQIIQRLQRPGMVEIKATASSGDIFQFRINIIPKGTSTPFNDYGFGP
jgi:hypothetical protein